MHRAPQRGLSRFSEIRALLGSGRVERDMRTGVHRATERSAHAATDVRTLMTQRAVLAADDDAPASTIVFCFFDGDERSDARGWRPRISRTRHEHQLGELTRRRSRPNLSKTSEWPSTVTDSEER